MSYNLNQISNNRADNVQALICAQSSQHGPTASCSVPSWLPTSSARELWLQKASKPQPTQTLIVPVLGVPYCFPNHTWKHFFLPGLSLHKIPHILLPMASEQSFHLGEAFLGTSDGTRQLPWWNDYTHVSRRDYPEVLCVLVSLETYIK